MPEGASRPSVMEQTGAELIGPEGLCKAPRNYNPGLLRYKGKLWMAYRSHLEDQGRCAIAICELAKENGKFVPKHNQWLKIVGPNGREHHEDSRLFMFRGEPYVAYSETNFYAPPKPYTCSIKYAKLRLFRNKWSVLETWMPKYGRNNGNEMEKNWQFFEREKELYCIYEGSPKHIIIKLDGEQVKDVHETEGPNWPWGIVRGGTPPVPYTSDSYITFFHSQAKTEIAPHYCRYYAGAYVFDAKPPFSIRSISNRYIMVGSELDGHAPDPRKADGWKPFVVFPCGCVPQASEGGWLVSLGVNDWRCATVLIKPEQLLLGRPDGSDREPRYLRTSNGSRPERYIDLSADIKWATWNVPRPSPIGAAEGFMEIKDPMLAEEIASRHHVEEISRTEYLKAIQFGGRQPVFA